MNFKFKAKQLLTISKLSKKKCSRKKFVNLDSMEENLFQICGAKISKIATVCVTMIMKKQPKY